MHSNNGALGPKHCNLNDFFVPRTHLFGYLDAPGPGMLTKERSKT